MPSLYDILGVARDSSQEEIQSAYRRIIARNHPDRQGGDVNITVEANKAWAILGDPDRRAHYDATGQTETDPPVEELIRNTLRNMYQSILRETLKAQIQARINGNVTSGFLRARPPSKHQILELLRESITEMLSEADHGLIINKISVEEIQSHIGHIIRKDGGEETVFSFVLQSELESAQGMVERTIESIGFLKKLLEALDSGFEYSTPDPNSKRASDFEAIMGKQFLSISNNLA